MGSPEVDDGTDEEEVGALGTDVGPARLDDGGVGANGDGVALSVGASACALCVKVSGRSVRLAATHRAAVVDEAAAVEEAGVVDAAAARFAVVLRERRRRLPMSKLSSSAAKEAARGHW